MFGKYKQKKVRKKVIIRDGIYVCVDASEMESEESTF